MTKMLRPRSSQRSKVTQRAYLCDWNSTTCQPFFLSFTCHHIFEVGPISGAIGLVRQGDEDGAIHNDCFAVVVFAYVQGFHVNLVARAFTVADASDVLRLVVLLAIGMGANRVIGKKISSKI